TEEEDLDDEEEEEERAMPSSPGPSSPGSSSLARSPSPAPSSLARPPSPGPSSLARPPSPGSSSLAMPQVSSESQEEQPERRVSVTPRRRGRRRQQQLHQLQAENQGLQQQLLHLAAQLAALNALAAPPPPPRRKCPVAVPDKFSRQPEMFVAFMGQCQLFMAMRPEDFPDDRTRLGFVISLLSGSAARWATPLLVQNSPLLTDCQGFWQHMRLMYKDPIRTQTAARRIKDICQGKRPLQDYIAEFCLLCMDSTWNDAALLDAFQDGLSEELQDELVRVEAPPTLDALVVQCLRIDARLQWRKTRRPVQELPSVWEWLELVFLPNQSRGIQAHVLVDSGATMKFMDQAFVVRFKVPLDPVDLPLQVETIDGRELIAGPIKFATQPLRLTIGAHEEAIHFYVTADLHFPLVLGMAWLWTHDPQVAWSQNAVSFPSLQCVDHICHACAGQDVSTPVVSLPPELRDFADVFSEKEADGLPPHRPYDCPVDLLPNASLPVEWFIRPSSSPLAAPVLFVKKKTGDLRLCCNYCRLNAITVRNRYPLPLILELMERLREATIFTKGDEWKTAFGTRYSHFEYTVMPFGLTNAPAVFQHFMNDVFRDMLDKFVVVYLDYILIYSWSRESHLQQVRLVLQRVRKHQLYVKLEKCLFFQTSIEFLGHIIAPEGIAMDPRKVEALCSWEPLRRVKDVQRLLGFANYYRIFIPGFAMLTFPLTQLLWKKVLFQWGPPQQQAFEALKKAFVTEPILRHPNPHRPFVVEMDTSNVAIGAVLLQALVAGGTLFPCAYYLRKLNPSERNYTIWEKELLAIKAAFEAWRHHLEGPRHQIEVRTDHRNLEHLTTARKLNQQQIRWSLFFAWFNFHVTYIPSGHNRRADALSRKPEYLCPKDSPPSADGAASRKPWLQPRRVHLLVSSTLYPLQTDHGGVISMDFLTHLPLSYGFTTVLVVVDMLTKMAHFIPCRALPTARTTARLFVKHIFCLHGLPDRVVSDRGMQFTAQFWKSLMTALQVQVCLSSSHHPETDGGMEKVIGILGQYLRCFVNQRQTDWADYLALAEFAFNISQHTSTQVTPFYTNVGYHPWFFPLTPSDSPVPEAQDFLSELYAVQQLVRQHLIQAKEDYKRYADRSRWVTPPLAVGDRVWLSTKHLPADRPVKKLAHRFVGPNPIEAVINPVAYRLTLPRSMKIHPVFHRSLLVPEAPSC
uniref:ribonuclease H n=1 Tax=Naja naja TaxID=35670 RepID=A0A8C6XG21_NAJNA